MSEAGLVRAVVSRELCASVAMCVVLAPDAFQLGEDGISTFIADSDVNVEQLRQAAEGCPMSAIQLIGDLGGQT
jgi:ferredoxin